MKLQKTASRYFNKTFLSFVSFLFGRFQCWSNNYPTFIISENCRRYELTSSSFVPFILPKREWGKKVQEGPLRVLEEPRRYIQLPGEGHSHIWTNRLCAVKQGMVFRGLSLVQFYP